MRAFVSCLCLRAFWMYKKIYIPAFSISPAPLCQKGKSPLTGDSY